jgi:hypothetical protein
MKRFIWTIFILSCLNRNLFAEDVSKANVFGGVSIFQSPSEASYGWMANAELHVKHRMGIVADFGGQRDPYDVVWTYQCLFGPRVSLRKSRWSFFGEALYGAEISAFDSGQFAMAYGGGINLESSRRFQIRLIQMDWVLTNTKSGYYIADAPPPGLIKNNFRFGSGIVFQFLRK